MVVLLGIGFVAGVVTAISPCVLPVLPILLAGGASGRHPVRIVAGLVASFTVFTLFASWILSKLGLPQDFLRNLAIVLLFVTAATLFVPRVALLVERPLNAFSRLRPRNVGGGFVFGATLGLVFVPCAGPVLATISVVAAKNEVGVRAILLTLAYALGAAVPMLAIAFGGREAAASLRRHASSVRLVSGALIAAVALGLVFHLDDHLAQLTPGYTSFFQSKVENNSTAKHELAKIRGGGTALAAAQGTSGLPDYGVAPSLHADGAWINSPPLTLSQLRGKVVLIDFWTYSCINCLRTLPYLKAWYRTYARDGFVIVGVHTPEFAFEHDVSNVRDATHEYGVRYPVAIDNDYGTWNAYGNQYWPAEYLIDARGHVREAKFGEGDYSKTEDSIRSLLAERDASLPRALHLTDHTPAYATTPESYLGSDRLERYEGSPIRADRLAKYTLPFVLDQSQLAYGGYWKVEQQRIVAGKDAQLRLHFFARKVHLVLGGTGTVQVLLNGKPLRSVQVTQDRLYTLLDQGHDRDGRLELRFTPGLSAYAFTFG